MSPGITHVVTEGGFNGNKYIALKESTL